MVPGVFQAFDAPRIPILPDTRRSFKGCIVLAKAYIRTYNVVNPRTPEEAVSTIPASTVEDYFHPLIADWFRTRYGEPTEIQKRVWPLIGTGNHLLMTAPTGSGKALAAFLWAINSLICGTWKTEALSVLYVSPLKALMTYGGTWKSPWRRSAVSLLRPGRSSLRSGS